MRVNWRSLIADVGVFFAVAIAAEPYPNEESLSQSRNALFLFVGEGASTTRVVRANGVIAAPAIPKLRLVLALVAWDIDMSESPIKGRA